MEKFFSILKSTFLFGDCDETAIHNIIKCLDGYQKSYKKNEFIYNLYDHIQYAGVVLDGEVNSIMINAADHELIMQHFNKSDMFAAAYACVPSEQSNMQIISQSDSTILFLKLSNLFLDKAIQCPYASRATANLLKQTAHNNIFQSKKVQILSQKHIRDRLLLFLMSEQKKVSPDDSSIIKIPFSRQELANYLGVERSALSREMCKMKEEGIIEFNKNTIIMLDCNI